MEDGTLTNDQALAAVVEELRLDYPEWIFGLTQTYRGRRLLARRPACTDGLYAVITEDPADLRRELDAAILSRVS